MTHVHTWVIHCVQCVAHGDINKCCGGFNIDEGLPTPNSLASRKYDQGDLFHIHANPIAWRRLSL